MRIFFFMGEDIAIHSFTADNIINLAGQIGGLYGTIMSSFEIWAFAINEKVLKAKLIRSLFFTDKPKKSRPIMLIATSHEKKL